MKHTIGNWYKIDGEFYMLAQTEAFMFCLIGLEGNRWADPIKCEPTNQYPLTISEKDFRKIAASYSYSYTTKIVKADIPVILHAITEQILRG